MGTEAKKLNECKQIGCTKRVSKPTHKFCYECFGEFQAWLHETDRELISLKKAQNQPDHATYDQDYTGEIEDNDKSYSEDQEWPNVKL